MVKEETADIQIRISKTTLETIEKHGTYPDKSPEGILRRILLEYEELKKTCGVEKKDVGPAIDADAKPTENVEEKPEDEQTPPE